MHFLLPERFTQPVVLIILLREKFKRNNIDWNLANFKKEFRKKQIRDSEVLNLYYTNKDEDVNNFVENFDLEVVVKNSDGILKYGHGAEKIFYDSSTRRCSFDPVGFYGLPRCIKEKIVKVDKMMQAAGVPLTPRDALYWENEPITFRNLKLCEDWFGIRVKVWTRSNGYNGIRLIKYQNLYCGDLASSGKTLCVHYQAETGQFFYIKDETKYFSDLHVCKNADQGCDFSFRSRREKEEHEIRCGEETVKIQQVELGPRGALIEKAQKAGLIPKLNDLRSFVFWDIESVLPQSTVKTAKTSVLQTHQVVSIAANR